MAVRVEWIQRGVRAVFSGVTGLNDVQFVDDWILSDPRGEEMRFQIMDYSGATEVCLSDEDMRIIGYLDRAMVNTLRISAGRIRLAVVADPGGVVRGAFEAYMEVISSEYWKCAFFDGIEAARKWLAGEGFEIPG